eukprot:1182318-Prorocentrum_minimum.AAC.7
MCWVRLSGGITSSPSTVPWSTRRCTGPCRRRYAPVCPLCADIGHIFPAAVMARVCLGEKRLASQSKQPVKSAHKSRKSLMSVRGPLPAKASAVCTCEGCARIARERCVVFLQNLRVGACQKAVPSPQNAAHGAVDGLPLGGQAGRWRPVRGEKILQAAALLPLLTNTLLRHRAPDRRRRRGRPSPASSALDIRRRTQTRPRFPFFFSRRLPLRRTLRARCAP